MPFDIHISMLLAQWSVLLIQLPDMLKNASNLLVSIGAIAASSLTLYWVIGAYDHWVTDYHVAVANGLFIVSALLLLPMMLGGDGWRPGLGVKNGKPWLFFGATLCLATYFSLPAVSGVLHLRLYFSVLFFGLALKIWFARADAATKSITLLAIVLVHLATLLLVLMAWGRADLPGTWPPYHGNIRHVSYHGMVAACLGCSLGIMGGRLRLIGYLGAFLALLGVAYLGSRGAMLGWLSFVAAALYLLPHKRRVFLTMAFLLIFSMVSANFLSQQLQPSAYAGNLSERLKEPDATGSGRIGIWAKSALAIRDSLIIGYGPDGYRASRCCPEFVVQSHNSVLQVLLEAGLLGLVAVIWLLWSSFRQPIIELTKQPRCASSSDQFQALLLSTIFGFLVYSLVDGLFFHVVPLVLFAIISSLFFSGTNRQKVSV